MTKEEIVEIKNFISSHNNRWKPYEQIDAKSIFVDDDCETTENVFNFIIKHQCDWNDYFNFFTFTKPLIQKLAMKLFNCGKMRADDCLFYQKIELQ